jgi:hypothetical protein
MSAKENKELIQRYIQAVDDNQTSDWSVIDEYVAEDFVAHNPSPRPRGQVGSRRDEARGRDLSHRNSRAPRDSDAGRRR